MVKKFILLSFCAFALAAQEIPFPANFTGWVRSNPGEIQADKEVKISKDHSLRIEGNGTAIATVNLEKGKKYMLRFSVKGEELEGGTRIVVNSPGVNRWYPVSSFPDKRLEKGTFDWRKGSGLLDPAILGGTKVSLHFKNYGKGKVWYDTLCLEEINSTLPDGWKNVYATPVAIDKEVKVSDASIRMENFGRIEKLFDLEDDAEYELSFYMKGKDIRGSKKDGAQVLICGADRKAWARANTNIKGEPELGTFDWKKGTRRFTGKYFKSNKVYIMPSISGSGTVWFDKIELKKLNDKKGNRAAANHPP